MKTQVEGKLPVTVWIPASLLHAADEIVRSRELTRADYLRSLMSADVLRFQSQQREATAP